ncbi:hypothetical protein [Kutzneria chonburiensis]|nr:hypothetical protein [Kutzneria chonburiensis]
MATLVILLSANNEMFGAIIELVRAWFASVEPTMERIHAAENLMQAGIRYSLAEPDPRRRQLMGHLLIAILSFEGRKNARWSSRYRLVGVDDPEASPDRLGFHFQVWYPAPAAAGDTPHAMDGLVVDQAEAEGLTEDLHEEIE